MFSDFIDRMQAQREMLKCVNSRDWPVAQLSALSDSAIKRWVLANDLRPDSALVSVVVKAGEALGFLANESQQQVSDEYRRQSLDFRSLIEAASNHLEDSSAEPRM